MKCASQEDAEIVICINSAAENADINWTTNLCILSLRVYHLATAMHDNTLLLNTFKQKSKTHYFQTMMYIIRRRCGIYVIMAPFTSVLNYLHTYLIEESVC